MAYGQTVHIAPAISKQVFASCLSALQHLIVSFFVTKAHVYSVMGLTTMAIPNQPIMSDFSTHVLP